MSDTLTTPLGGVEPGYGGRVWIRCYDDVGEMESILNEDGHLTGPYDGRFYFAPGGFGYVTSGDSEDDLFFRVDEDVKKVAIFITGGTNECRLRGFSIFSVDGGHAAVWSGYEEGISGSNLGTTAPLSGTWERGRIVLNAEPSAAMPIGWVCVTSGSPGLWLPFGYVAAEEGVPAVSTWGLGVLALLILATATILVRRKHRTASEMA